MSSVIWRDPPVHQGVPGVWEPVLRELMTRPGYWAVIRKTDDVEKAYRHTANLRHARLIKVPAGFWEFTARKNGEGGEVYGRYLGANASELALHMSSGRITTRLVEVKP